MNLGQALLAAQVLPNGWRIAVCEGNADHGLFQAEYHPDKTLWVFGKFPDMLEPCWRVHDYYSKEEEWLKAITFWDWKPHPKKENNIEPLLQLW